MHAGTFRFRCDEIDILQCALVWEAGGSGVQ